MEYLHYLENPELRRPVMLLAFTGWSDASEVATWSARFLVRRWSAVKFAEIDPEEFFVFTETRPHVRLTEGNQRSIIWPTNDFYYHRAVRGERDFIVLVGAEPQLKWKAFAEAVLGLIRHMEVSIVLTMGGLLAPVPHTQAVRLTGTATDPDLLKHLGDLGVNTSRYEGPTGITGVLGVAMNQAHITTANLWGNVPHYLSARPNVKVSLAMLRQLDRVFQLEVDLTRVEQRAALFDAQVSQAIAENPEIVSYVKKLEEEHGRTGEEASPPSEELPSGEALIQDLEDFLRSKRDEEGENKR